MDGAQIQNAGSRFLNCFLNKMSKKFYLITIATTLVIAACIVSLFVYFRNRTQQDVISEIPEENKSSYELLPIGELAKKPSLDIQTEKGIVPINNIYKNPIEKLSKNGIAFANNNDYYIAYYPQDNGFLISINNPDVVTAERKAEENFLNQLGITKDQACQLKVSITVSFGVSEKYSGSVYGLSFCPGSNAIN